MFDSLYSRLYALIPFHWPPDQGWRTTIENANYAVANIYLVRDCALILLALLWGFALTGTIIRLNNNKFPNAQLNAAVLVTLCLSTGFAIMIASLFLLVLFASLTTTAVIVIFTIITCMAAYFAYISRKDIWRIIVPLHISNMLLTGLVILILAIYQIASASLPLLSDATSYHAPYARFFLLNLGLQAAPEHLIYPYHSLNLNLLYSLGLLVDSNISYIQTIHAMFGILTMFGMYAFGRQIGLPAFVSILTLVIFISSIPIIHHYRYSANVDNGSMFFGLCCVLALYLWIQFRSTWLLAISGTAFGLAIGTKYLMCAFVFPAVLCLFYTQPRDWKPITTFLGWTAAWGFWWYIRNLVLTGNPFHPFASNIFGLYLWDINDVRQQMAGLHDERIPRTLAGFFAMPYYAYHNDILASQGAAIQLGMMYVMTLFFWRMDWKLNSLLVFCWCYLVIWFFGAQDPRYMMPITPLIIIYTGAAVAQLYLLVSRWRVIMLSINCLATLTALIAFAYYSQQEYTKVYYSDIGSSPEVQDRVLRQNLTYDLMSHANEAFTKDDTVYEFYMRDARWFFKGNLVGNQFGPHGYYHLMFDAYDQAGNIAPDLLENELKERYGAVGFIIPNGNYQQESFDQHFDLQYRNNLGAVYKFKTH